MEPVGNPLGLKQELRGRGQQKSKIVKLVAAKETGLHKLGLFIDTRKEKNIAIVMDC